MKTNAETLGTPLDEGNASWIEMTRTAQRICAALNGRRFAEFLGFCDPEFRYRATVYSPELRREMVWLEAVRTDLENLYELLPKQVASANSLRRFVNVIDVRLNPSNETMAVESSLAVYRTDVDGATTLFAIGQYADEFRRSAEGLKMIRRELRLETRMLDSGTLEVL